MNEVHPSIKFEFKEINFLDTVAYKIPKCRL